MNKVEMIPISKIRVLNARARNKAKFREIIDSISKVGLKKPVTVSPREDGVDGYDLVCGQGRLEVYAAKGEVAIPALVVDMSLHDRYLRSLVENLARRTPTPLEMARRILSLKEGGYSQKEISAKIGVSDTHVCHLLRLLEQGEERLVVAVERGEIPITVAIEIASSEDEGIQRSLQAAYESKKLRGRALIKARRIIEERRVRGKSMRVGPQDRSAVPSPHDLVRALRKESQKQELLIRKAHLCEQELRFVMTALKQILGDEKFVSLLRAEKLAEFPMYLADALKR